jgi:hypothetical protein
MPSAEPSYPHDPTPAVHDLDPLADSCCICYHPYSLNLMDPEAEEPVQLVCGHFFGATCIGKWVRTNSTCPLCRAELKSQTTIVGKDVVEDLSWQDEVEYDSDTNGVSEAEYLNAQQGFETPLQIHYRTGEDIWLTVAYQEELTPLYTPHKPSFSFDDIDTVELAMDDWFTELVDCHDELVDSHGQWMNDYLHDEGAIDFFDVLSY